MVTWDGGRCYTCDPGTGSCNGSEANSAECGACSGQWGVATFANCNESDLSIGTRVTASWSSAQDKRITEIQFFTLEK